MHKVALRGDGFTFKQFFIAHDRCAMKVGTDGILLGAWAPIFQGGSILDIGCGSGLLAMMLAQRTSDTTAVDAVELDPAAAQQAGENVRASPWASRMALYEADIHHWQPPEGRRYSLIVSNPPYYQQGVPCASREREQARYTTTLSYQSLLDCARLWISEQGMFCVVLPMMTADTFITQAVQSGWYLRQHTDVAETERRPPHRALLAFSLQQGDLTRETLVIRGPDKHYSAAFCQLTKDFYLAM